MNTKKLNTVSTVTELSDNEHIPVILADGSIGKIKKNILVPLTGSESIKLNLEEKGWYRIATHGVCHRASSGIFNIGNSYNSTSPFCVCFYLFGSGYTTSFLNIIGKTTAYSITKIRVIYKRSTTEPIFIDMFYDIERTNTITISLSNATFLTLQTPLLVGEETPEGYSVKEFIL